jgi:hypothetical protein
MLTRCRTAFVNQATAPGLAMLTPLANGLLYFLDTQDFTTKATVTTRPPELGGYLRNVRRG